MFLRIMGVFPYTRPKPGAASFPLISPAMGYSVLVFISLLVILNHRIIEPAEKGNKTNSISDLCHLHSHKSNKNRAIAGGEI